MPFKHILSNFSFHRTYFVYVACIFLNVTTKGRQTNTQTSCFCFKGHKYTTEFCLSLTPLTLLNCRMQSTSAHRLACEVFWMNVCWDWYKLTCGLGMKWFDTLLKCTLTSLNYWALFFRTNDRFFQTIPKRPLCNRPNCAKYDKKNKGLNSFLTNLYLFWLILLSSKRDPIIWQKEIIKITKVYMTLLC